MFIIGEAVIEDQIARERFACDLGRCHGDCCTLPGGRGAPLDDDEIVELSRAFPAAKQYLPERLIRTIETQGYYEGGPGNFATTCVDERECVFVFYENDIACCSLERAYQKGETEWRKPLSCHLFPIRISSLLSDRLRYEKISECHSAVRRGLKENMPLYEFLREPLIRKYGAEWYREFFRECLLRDPEHVDANHDSENDHG